MRAIQKIIQVTNTTAMIDRIPPNRSWSRQVMSREVKVEHGAEAEGEGDRQSHTDPDPRQQVAPFDLDEVGDEDADDQRSLEALAQTDQVVREHFRPSCLGRLAPIC